MSRGYSTQNQLLLNKLLTYYKKDNNLQKILSIINGESKISLRLIDWFATNYAKKNFIVYNMKNKRDELKRFKVYVDYKLKLKAYSKRRFDPFCRWDRINIPYNETSYIQTTIGQLNFFKWALDNKIIEYVLEHYEEIEKDMNGRNSTARNKDDISKKNKKTRKKREELSVSATKSIKKEDVEIIVKFH